MDKIHNNITGIGIGDRRAFTLIEIIIVVVILGIAMTMAVPMFSSAGSVQVDSAANIIASDLEYARSMAITRQQSYAVLFNAATESYEVLDHNGVVIKHPVKGSGFDYVVNFPNERGLGQVVIESVNIDSGSKIAFDYIGAPFNEGGTEMGAGAIAISAGGITRTITIEPVTGYIKIE